ncbi:hypothetical protein M407DRAFT_241500, partial [Tulasnella calospora MUT 4182]
MHAYGQAKPHSRPFVLLRTIAIERLMAGQEKRSPTTHVSLQACSVFSPIAPRLHHRLVFSLALRLYPSLAVLLRIINN